MNRIELPAQSMQLSPSNPESPAQRDFDIATIAHPRLGMQEVAPHATFAPMHYEAGYAYPLVVWLHSAVGSEQQLRRVMPQLSMRNYVGVAPRGTRRDRSRPDGYHWHQSGDHIEEAENRIFDCIDAASRRFNVHPDRVFLAGYGNGGTMALRIAWNNPERFAGVATIGGSLPTDHRPFRLVNHLRRVPCFLATARQSQRYPEPQVCRDLRLLHAAGCVVALRQYPCGDELTTTMLSDLDHWLMERVCGSGEQ